MAVDELKQPQRRSVLARVVLLLGGLAGVEAGWIVTSFLRPRDRRAGVDGDLGVVVAGPIERFAPGSVTAFRAGKFYLARLEDGGFLALYRRCTHLGCTVPWLEDEQRFACPCHASSFDLHGDVLSPPAPRPLDLFAVRIENGIVKVDTSRTLRRNAFQQGQVTRA
jgi:cytochrome b6-f complex iron-sulfur subunit